MGSSIPDKGEPFGFSWSSLSRALAGMRSDISFAVVDSVLIAVCYTAALAIRFADRQGIDPNWWEGFAVFLPIAIVVHLISNAAVFCVRSCVGVRQRGRGDATGLGHDGLDRCSPVGVARPSSSCSTVRLV